MLLLRKRKPQERNRQVEKKSSKSPTGPRVDNGALWTSLLAGRAYPTGASLVSDCGSRA